MRLHTKLVGSEAVFCDAVNAAIVLPLPIMSIDEGFLIIISVEFHDLFARRLSLKSLMVGACDVRRT